MKFKFVTQKNPKIFRVLPAIFLVFLTSCTPTGNVVVDVEIADDFEERSIGLMYRENLDENAGMFFIFEEPTHKSFWMKNTLIPLDLIFISGDFEVVDIKKNFEPCEEGICETYKSKEKAKYVLEVNSGFVEKYNIKIGSRVRYDGSYVYFGEE